MGITIINAQAKDSTKLLNDTSNLWIPNSFDRVLLDPPCSGLGNRPRFDDDMSLENLVGYSDYQKKLVNIAVRLLKVDGYMTYSTCTVNPMENEEVVSYILQQYGKSIALVEIDSKYRLGQPVLLLTSSRFLLSDSFSRFSRPLIIFHFDFKHMHFC